MMSEFRWRNRSVRMCSMLASEPVSRLSTQITRWPRASSSSHMCEPTNPAPPVTRQVAMGRQSTHAFHRNARRSRRSDARPIDMCEAPYNEQRSREMAAARFVERLNEQIAYEFAAQQQYIANAVYYDGQTLPRLAAFFYAQAVEERNHALMMVRYLLDADARVVIPGIQPPETEFDDIVAPVALALDQER